MECSVYMTLEGVKPPNAKFIKMKAIYDACQEGEINVPQEVLKFFGMKYEDSEEGPIAEGVRVPMGTVELMDGREWSGIHDSLKDAVRYEYHDDDEDGSQQLVVLVDLSKIPKDIKLLRIMGSVSY